MCNQGLSYKFLCGSKALINYDRPWALVYWYTNNKAMAKWKEDGTTDGPQTLKCGCWSPQLPQAAQLGMHQSSSNHCNQKSNIHNYKWTIKRNTLNLHVNLVFPLDQGCLQGPQSSGWCLMVAVRHLFFKRVQLLPWCRIQTHCAFVILAGFGW